MDDVLDISACRLAQRVRDRSASVLDLVDAHIARIKRVNPSINAVAARRFDAARRDALAVEARIANAPRRAPLPPLLGVPFTVQEAIGVAGLPHTGGLIYRWNRTAREDGPLVRRLRAAGALPLAVTNQPEACLGVETKNLIYGRTRNPWGAEHTAGGACGGEAALIASGGSPLGAGGGLLSAVSIPAAFCGVPAHQPSAQLIPSCHGWGGGKLRSGLLARRVEDLVLLLNVLTKEPLPPAPPDLSGVRILRLGSWAGVQVSSAMTETLERACEALICRGARVERLQEPALEDAIAIWGAALRERTPDDFAELLGDGRSVPVLREAARFVLGRSNHTASALVLAMVEAIRRRLPSDRPSDAAAGKALRERLAEHLGHDGVILHPPYGRPAPRHRGTWLTPSDLLLSGLFDVLGMPGTVVPMGFDVSGLPLAAQISGRRGDDARTLAVAAALEADFGGWVRAQPMPLR
ncbi:MAG: amidase [Myxococcota bacterium]